MSANKSLPTRHKIPVSRTVFSSENSFRKNEHLIDKEKGTFTLFNCLIIKLFINLNYIIQMNTLERTQNIPIGLEEAWDFFSSPENLAKITPAYMEFTILNEVPEKITDDLLIKYRVRPLLGIPMKWVTLIKEVNAPVSFIDEQIKGPYKYWSHLHTFRSIPGGTEIKDKVDYISLPGFPGKMADKLIVNKKLNQIFEYREKVMKDLFGEYK